MKWSLYFVLICSLSTQLKTIAEDDTCDAQDCRKSSKDDFYPIGAENVKEILSQPVFHDLWGYPVNWKDSSQGWNATYRKMMVLIHNGILDQRGKMKKVTKNGYQTMAIPKSAHKILVKTRNMKAQSPLFCGDSVPFPMSNCQVPGELTNNRFMRLNFPENQKIFFHDDVLEHVRPLAEKWSKQKLSSDASIFGIRYLTGAWLSLFVAPKEEKTIGVILQMPPCCFFFFWFTDIWQTDFGLQLKFSAKIAGVQKVEIKKHLTVLHTLDTDYDGASGGCSLRSQLANVPEPSLCWDMAYLMQLFSIIEQEVAEKWPLTLIDNQNKRKKIFLKAGQMIMFESSRMPLGRQYPLNGTFYDELLVYFPPLNRTEILSHNYYAEDV